MIAKTKTFINLIFLISIIILSNMPSISAIIYKEISWLKANQYSNGLVESQIGWNDHRSFTYDQAGVIIAFAHSGNLSRARKLLNVMRELQNDDGSWYDSYNTDTKIPWEWSKSTGNTAWMVIAINYYESETSDRSYATVAEKALVWMKKRVDKNASSECYGAVNLGENFWNIAHPELVFSTEHNLDAYSAFRNRARLTSDPVKRERYINIASGIKNYLITEAWNGSVFYRGCKDYELWLDAQTWGYMVLGDNYVSGVYFAEANMINTLNYRNQTIEGFQYNNYNGNSIWVEGTNQMIDVFFLMGNRTKAKFYRAEMDKVIKADGGMPYSFNGVGGAIAWPDNLRYSSASSVFWHYFARNHINPFKI